MAEAELAAAKRNHTSFPVEEEKTDTQNSAAQNDQVFRFGR
jgi:hypothetical protein